MSFETRTLKELTLARAIDIKTGPFGTQLKASDYVPEGIPVINVRNIGFGNIVDEKLERISQETAQRLSAHLLATNDIIFGRKGAVERHAFVGESCNGWLQGSDCIRLRVLDKTKVIPRYISYFFLTTEHKNRMMSLCSHGSTMASLNQSILEVIEVPYTSIENQEKIVIMLKPLDDKIELNNRIIANLEAQAQAIFKSWFVDFEPFQDGEFEDSELGLIPKGWRVGTFSDLGKIEGGSTPSKSEPSYYCEHGIPWITPRDLSSDKRKFIDRGVNDITESGLKNSSAKILPTGTVLFSSRAPIGYITIAKNGVSTNQGFKSVVPFDQIGTAYVYYYLKQNTNRIIAAANGSTFKEISGTVLKNLPALVPEAQILKDFSAICETLFKQQAVLEEQYGILTKIRDALLPKLMSGEIEVPVEE